jgi:hypothetical protein
MGLLRKTDVVGVASLAADQHRVFKPRHGLANGEFLDCQPILNRLIGVFRESMEVHDDQIRKVLDPFEIKNLAQRSNRPPNIAHRRAKHGIALYSAPVTFPSIQALEQ